MENNWKTTDQLYYSRYHFNLFSNFTFFFDDTMNGDMIRQRESRNIFGYTTTASKSWLLGNKKANTELGGGFRFDDVNSIELSKAVKRQFLDYTQLGDMKETNGFLYINQNIELTDKLNMNAAVRYDNFRFGYQNKLAGENDFRYRKNGVISPKLNFNYAVNPRVKVFFNNGIGFHSNDTRVILDNAADDILPRVIGTDLGVIIKPV
ncbi:MAG: TonB-dependent receptor [Bacteroidia bacterium]|nr:TonB-dependent receptor [Bacteroidia bacterium]